VNGRPIIFGPGDKLRWLEAIASDRRAKGLDVRIAIGITNRIDKYTGSAPIAQTWLAAFVGGSERGVRDAADHLSDLGHLAIDRSEAVTASNRRAFGGRGKANVYRPILRPMPNGETRNHSAGFVGEETRQSSTLNPAISRTKPGTPVPPLPNTYLNSSLPHDTPSCGGGDARWNSIKEGLSKRLSAAVVSAWFDPVTLAAVNEREVVLTAPSRFHSNYLENNYARAMLDACQAFRQTVESVRVVVHIARAAE
jgi:hypothetical protein